MIKPHTGGIVSQTDGKIKIADILQLTPNAYWTIKSWKQNFMILAYDLRQTRFGPSHQDVFPEQLCFTTFQSDIFTAFQQLDKRSKMSSIFYTFLENDLSWPQMTFRLITYYHMYGNLTTKKPLTKCQLNRMKMTTWQSFKHEGKKGQIIGSIGRSL